ncbi:MAG TPA: hypothetical protein VH374_19985 [Polyangia bacterium]|jgi:hypothetical protein|nr:hypothetical protein [Polyangia bacterium]
MIDKFVATVMAHSQTNGATATLSLTAKFNSFAPLRAGPPMIVVGVPILVAAVGAMASTGTAQFVSGLMAGVWAVMAPAALFSRWTARLLPLISTAFLCLSILALPFNSAAFIGDVWAALAMALLTLPRPRRTPIAH